MVSGQQRSLGSRLRGSDEVSVGVTKGEAGVTNKMLRSGKE